MSYDENGKPRSKLCRLRVLMEWTGWERRYISYLVSTNRLRTFRDGSHKRYYYVESAQDILEGRETA